MQEDRVLEESLKSPCMQESVATASSASSKSNTLRLKKLSLHGFKSFAGKSQVLLNRGITAIVGPNGCGKSNIVDAIRWVLGEPSAKNLRADTMSDVLFAGSEKEKPSSLAEVTLEFEGTLADKPLIYDAFEITRRLFRTGESEYRINHKIARLKDIHDLFADTGVGKNTFAIFEQGKIEQMIAMSHAQRRLIIEEAAGISGYKATKKQALAKWQELNLQIEQLTAASEAILERKAKLQEQAKRALEYKEIQERIKNLEKRELARDWHAADDLLQKLTLDIKKSENSKEELTKQLNELLNEHEQITLGFETQRKEYETLQDLWLKAHANYSHEFEKCNQGQLQLSHLKRQVENMLAEMGEKRVKKENLHKKKSEIENEKLKLEKDQKQKHQELQDCLHRLHLAIEADFEQRKKLDSLIQEKQRAETEAKIETARLHGLEKQYALLKAQEERKIESVNKETKRVEQLTQEIAERNNKLQQYHALVKQEQEQLNSLSCQLHQNQESETRLKDQESSLQLEIKQLEKEFEWNNRLLSDTLFKNQAWSFFSKENHQHKVKPFGNFASLCHVPAGLEKFRFLDKTLVISTLKEAILAIEALEFKGISSWSFLVLEELFKGAGQAIKSDKEISLDDPYFAQMMIEVLLTKIQDYEQQMPSCYLRLMKLTKGSALIDAAGLLQSYSQNPSSLEIKETLPALLTKIEREKKALETCSFELREVRSNLEKQKNLVKESEKNLKHLNDHQSACSLRIKAAERELELAKERLHEEQNFEVKTSLTPLQTEVDELHNKVKMLEAKHREAEKAKETESKRAHETRSALQSMEREKGTLERSLREWQTRLENLEITHKNQHERFLEIEIELEGLEERLFESEEQLKTHLSTLEKSREDLESAKQAEKDLKSSLERVKEILAKAEQNKKAAQVKENQLHTALRNEEISFQSLTNKHEKAMWQRSKYEQEMETRFGLLVDMFEIEDGGEASPGEFKKLRKQLEEFGEVNFAAMNDLEEIDTRSSLMQAQISDIKASEHEVMRMIATLDERCKKQFLDTFQKVNEAFAANFKLLFEGGEAELKMVGQDEQSLGIEIYACPPGKQLKSMMLMSGGEKCLTSVALMMALFEVKPAPFCLLDEIDAPLDDANVDRFIRLVSHYSDKTQVFIITHNKKTMEAASTLIGVSMPSRGVSKIFTLDLENRSVMT